MWYLRLFLKFNYDLNWLSGKMNIEHPAYLSLLVGEINRVSVFDIKESQVCEFYYDFNCQTEYIFR